MTGSPYLSAVTAERAGRYSEALELFLMCLARGEGDPADVQFHCGWCLENGAAADRTRALGYYEAAALTARDPGGRLNSLFRAGWIALQSGDQASAADRFRAVIDLARAERLDHEIYHHGTYWYAFCLEAQGRFLQALDWYRTAGALAPTLLPEARWREIGCLNQVGWYAEAYGICRCFEEPQPDGFDPRRYEHLRETARSEAARLLACLAEAGAGRRGEHAGR